jgi:hypothetical protein
MRAPTQDKCPKKPRTRACTHTHGVGAACARLDGSGGAESALRSLCAPKHKQTNNIKTTEPRDEDNAQTTRLLSTRGGMRTRAHAHMVGGVVGIVRRLVLG